MDKQMIEEMARIIRNAKIQCRKKFCEECEYANKSGFICDSLFIADSLVKAGYCKITEGVVVLTEEELKEKIDCCDVSMIHHDDDGKRYIEYEKYEDFTDRLGKRIQQLKGQLKQARKETAEKFAERVKMAFYYHFDELIPSIMAKDIDEIAKEFTEGK